MGIPAIGEVVLVPFPFSDLSQSKVRPAVCLATAGRGDWILCQITSSPYGDANAISLGGTDFQSGGLRTHSFARPGKLFTAHSSLILSSAGKLTETCVKTLIDAVIVLLRP
jgi:mRNA interferase MazF